MQISSIRRHFSACKHWFSDLAYQITLKKCVRPFVLRNKSILDTFKIRISWFCFLRVSSYLPFFQYGATNFWVCDPPKKLSVDIYLQWKTSFILYDDEVNSLKSIQRLRLIVYQMYWWNARKQSIFHTGVATLQAIFQPSSMLECC